MSEILIRNGRLIDPRQGIDRPASLLLRDRHVIGIDVKSGPDATIVDAHGMIVSPGFVDTHVQLREPGFEEDETIKSGTAAALAGGFTSIACLPDTDPPLDSQAGVEFVQHQAARADNCNVLVLACVSKNRDGEQLAELGTLCNAGAVGFTDAMAPIHSAELMRRALEYSQMFDRPILNHPEVIDLTRNGIMHEGLVSTILGLASMPAEAEDVMTGRDVRLAEATGGRLHLLNISSGGSVDLIRRAKSRGVNITAGVCAHHLVLTDEALRTFDTNCKVNPPLRSKDHVEQLILGLQDNTLDVICSGHAPRPSEKKMHELDQAPFGMVGLETVLGIVGLKLIATNLLCWTQVIEKLSANPARILGQTAKGHFGTGADADVTIFDPHARWTVDLSRFESQSSNSPLAGWELQGRVECTIVAGRIKYRRSRS